MSLVIASVGGGAYCAWRFVGGWSGFSLHPMLGVATMSGMVMQVLIAMCRCSPHHSSRFIFNWIHFSLGNATHICAIATILSAYEATPLPVLFLYLMGAFIVFHILIHLIMQIKRQPSVDGKSILFSLSLLQNVRESENDDDDGDGGRQTTCSPVTKH